MSKKDKYYLWSTAERSPLLNNKDTCNRGALAWTKLGMNTLIYITPAQCLDSSWNLHRIQNPHGRFRHLQKCLMVWAEEPKSHQRAGWLMSQIRQNKGKGEVFPEITKAAPGPSPLPQGHVAELKDLYHQRPATLLWKSPPQALDWVCVLGGCFLCSRSKKGSPGHKSLAVWTMMGPRLKQQ